MELILKLLARGENMDHLVLLCLFSLPKLALVNNVFIHSLQMADLFKWLHHGIFFNENFLSWNFLSGIFLSWKILLMEFSFSWNQDFSWNFLNHGKFFSWNLFSFNFLPEIFFHEKKFMENSCSRLTQLVPVVHVCALWISYFMKMAIFGSKLAT